MPTTSGIVIVGLAEFRAAATRAAAANPRLITSGLKKAGVPIVAEIASRAPRRTGRLAAGFSTAVAGPRADIVSRVPYAGGAEWGSRGKWAGFAGSPPRFVVPSIEARLDAAALILEHELRDVISIYGWAG